MDINLCAPDSPQKVMTHLLNEWLSCTTLLSPKLSLLSMLQPAPSTNQQQQNRTQSKWLRVEAMGSGTDIVPYFEFDDNTSVTELLQAIKRSIAETHEQLLFQVFYGEVEVTETQMTVLTPSQRMEEPRNNLSVLVDFGIDNRSVLSVVVESKLQMARKCTSVAMLVRRFMFKLSHELCLQ